MSWFKKKKKKYYRWLSLDNKSCLSPYTAEQMINHLAGKQPLTGYVYEVKEDAPDCPIARLIGGTGRLD